MSGTHYWHINERKMIILTSKWICGWERYIPTPASWERIRRAILRYGVKLDRYSDSVEIMLGAER